MLHRFSHQTWFVLGGYRIGRNHVNIILQSVNSLRLSLGGWICRRGFKSPLSAPQLQNDVAFQRFFVSSLAERKHRATNVGLWLWVNNLCALNYHLFLVVGQLRDKVGMAHLDIAMAIPCNIYIYNISTIYACHKNKYIYICVFFNEVGSSHCKEKNVGTTWHVPFPFCAAKVQRCHRKVFERPELHNQSEQGLGSMNPEGQAAKGLIGTEVSNWKAPVVETNSCWNMSKQHSSLVID